MTGSLSEYVAGSIESARTSEAPFYHLEFDRVFPDDVYAAMLRAMPEATDYRPMHGRAKGHDLEDGTAHAGQDRPVSGIHPPPAAGEARDLGPGRRARSARARSRRPSSARSRPASSAASATTFAKVGMYPDPDSDPRHSGLSDHAAHRHASGRASPSSSICRATTRRRHIGTIFHDVLPDGSMPKHTQMKFSPNTGYAFAVGDNTWHSADPDRAGGQDPRLRSC